MKSICKVVAAASLSFLAIGASAEPRPYTGVTGVSLPGVKLSTVREPVVQEITDASPVEEMSPIIEPMMASPIDSVEEKKPQPKGKRPEQFPLDIVVSSGVNELISVSKGYPNRILTPFEDPVVDTLQGSNKSFLFDKKGSVLLISPTTERPVGIFVRENGQFDNAISLTLIPKAIPPREIHLKFDGSQVISKKTSRRAKTWEKSQPFVSLLGNLYSDLVKGKLPSGYSLTKPEPQDVYQFNCDFGDAPIYTTLEQLVEGGELRVGVLSAYNDSDVPLEPRESSCDNFGVASVAFYPSVIKPKSYSEVFIVSHQHTQFDEMPERPSVIPVNAK